MAEIDQHPPRPEVGVHRLTVVGEIGGVCRIGEQVLAPRAQLGSHVVVPVQTGGALSARLGHLLGRARRGRSTRQQKRQDEDRPPLNLKFAA
jgi:hypothetical protein